MKDEEVYKIMEGMDEVRRGDVSGKSQTAGSVSDNDHLTLVLKNIVRYGEEYGIKRVVQICDMTLNGIDVFKDTRMDI